MPKKKPVSEEVETQTTPVVTQTPEPTEKPKAKRKTKKKISSNWDKLRSESSHIGKRSRESSQEPQPKKRKLKESLPLIINEDKSITKYVALDCEMVGVGPEGEESMLARVLIVNAYGNVIYDKFVAARETVTDYRTHVSGIRPEDLLGAPTFEEVQKDVAQLIKGRIVVGHALENDFKALLLSHPFTMTRDTAKYRPLQRRKNTPHALRYLAGHHLGVQIQAGEHDPSIDARAALLLYNKFRKEWESSLKKRNKSKAKGKIVKDPVKE